MTSSGALLYSCDSREGRFAVAWNLLNSDLLRKIFADSLHLIYYLCFFSLIQWRRQGSGPRGPAVTSMGNIFENIDCRSWDLWSFQTPIWGIFVIILVVLTPFSDHQVILVLSFCFAFNSRNIRYIYYLHRQLIIPFIAGSPHSTNENRC